MIRCFSRFTAVCAVAGVSVLALVASSAHAQSNLSMQGFGYPLSGASTRVAGSADALIEFDPVTPRNPATLVALPRSLFSIQAEPEYRTLSLDVIRERTNVQRIPLIALALRVSSRMVLSLSDAGFLDRSFSTASTGTAVVDGQLLATQDRSSVKGTISDFRGGIGYAINSRISVGLGGHVFTGDSKLKLTRQFSDTTNFGTVIDTAGVEFVGRALSFGGQVLLPKGFVTSASYRAGSTFNAERRDSTLRTASVPNQLGVGLLYNGLAGAIFAANIEHTNWTAMDGLGSTNLVSRDVTNWSVGTELTGTRIRGAPILYRIGVANNKLPFGVNSAFVNERRFSVGATLPLTSLAREQAALDFSLQRANRKLTAGPATEAAWLFGIGLQIRP